MRNLRIFLAFCFFILVTPFSKMSTPNTVTGNPFKSKQCITLDLAKQIASAAAQEVIHLYRQLFKLHKFISTDTFLKFLFENKMHFPQAIANNWSVVCCILDDGGNVVYLVRFEDKKIFHLRAIPFTLP